VLPDPVTPSRRQALKPLPIAPVTLSVSGTENSSSATVPSSGSIADDDFALAGNPYASTIDFDNITLNNVAVTTSVWDDANSDWKTWNKTSQSGDLTGGLIAPYQGFWIEGDGGSGTITIETADKSSSSGTFYRTLDGDNMGRMVFNVSSDGHSSSNYFSFHEGGTLGVDDGESELLLPFQASSRVVMMSVVEGDAHKISSYPYDQEGSLSIPFDVMRLSLDETNYVTVAEEVTLTWDLEELPDHISMTLTDNITGTETYLDYESEYVFTTEPKGSFSANYDGPIGTYPVVGEPRFTLSVTYGALGQNDDATLPSDFALHPIYPNPFNPSATISFDIPDVSLVALNIYDVKGALVETLLQNHMKPGKHHYNWEPQGLSSGVYFMKLTTAKQTFTQKVTYIK
ncbi:MAG: T9SS type A sorting domain-containing protein, partial [Candidatus Marinimicrobia bacterium]|nr:T9SS type A sorting domain-containing protein [Candidatus Neomarinimicrobiota bacterium]